ncbi:membrane protein insertion efficiency factor YidD [Paludibacter sp. 221]|uniref:membrane protein insertion efficiency factor YidD n=1 Tax=Paludibacter sp. 221 TaxID=2302939 RepID=UPI0013D30485|nr:membrane protein insertion efficiency factor YidD [Paludibacter sp. 221]
MIFLKRILILIIELYQHYAPEEMRRKCLLMPTCSEYALLALQKHGVIKGLYKTYIRLTKKCKGETYYIDYP